MSRIIQNVPPSKNKSKLLVFLLFVVVSSVLWLLIKLSDTYNLSVSIPVVYTELPAGKWMPEQTDSQLGVTLNSRGFVLFRARYLRNVKKLEIPLSTVPYRKRSQTEYYINTANLREMLARAYNMNETDIEFDEAELRFQLDELYQVKVAVRPQLEIAFRPQYQEKDGLTVVPDSVLVYGPKHLLDTIQHINTYPIALKDVDKDVQLTIPLRFNPSLLRSEPEEVEISLAVDRFTEASFPIPIRLPQSPTLKTFPDIVQVSFQLSLSDYNLAAASLFTVVLDTTGMFSGQSTLRVFLAEKPDFVRNISLNPETVEFIRIIE